MIYLSTVFNMPAKIIQYLLVSKNLNIDFVQPPCFFFYILQKCNKQTLHICYQILGKRYSPDLRNLYDLPCRYY